MPTASLLPLPPLDGDAVTLEGSPFILGSDADCQLRATGAGIAPHHALLQFHDGGWWARALDAPLQLNGVPVLTPTRLRDRDRLALGGVGYEFASGEARTRRMESIADMVARPRKRGYGRLPGPARNLSLTAAAGVALAALLVIGAGAVAWYGLFHATKSIGVLTDQQAAQLDSLLILAYDHVERGGTLLELGLGEGAADEFAKAVNTLSLSGLRNNPQVKPRIEKLEASVAAIYRERSLAVPDNYARATSPLTPEQLKTASLSTPEFAASFALMAAAFAARFGHSIIVSGRDHAEHVALYGKGGAMDLSIKTMSAVEIAFIINRCHTTHIRVKDFSQDSVLRRQVQTAIRKGLLFEAGTGLHLHIDRFANRRDRWTTLRLRGSLEDPPQLLDRGTAVGLVVQRSGDRRGE